MDAATTVARSWELGSFESVLQEDLSGTCTAAAGADSSLATDLALPARRRGGLAKHDNSFITGGQPPWQRPAVHWNPVVRFRLVPGNDDLNQEDRLKMFWTGKELLGFSQAEFSLRQRRCVPLPLYHGALCSFTASFFSQHFARSVCTRS